MTPKLVLRTILSTAASVGAVAVVGAVVRPIVRSQPNLFMQGVAAIGSIGLGAYAAERSSTGVEAIFDETDALLARLYANRR